ncbi:MAG TPA: hypothetical protein VKU87_00595, partial [Thermomicrobiaceae bacterium]|nr:hypothetical protein [Thermomicrobiaceae bacterium]
ARMIEKSKNSDSFFSKMSRKMQEQAEALQDEDAEERVATAPAARSSKSGTKKKSAGPKVSKPVAPIPSDLVPRKSHGGQSLKASHTSHNGNGTGESQPAEDEAEPAAPASELTPRRSRRAREAPADALQPDDVTKSNGRQSRRPATRNGNGKLRDSHEIANDDGRDRDEAIIGERRQGEHGADADEER